jgi:glyoxylase-like metal-dependent hydrolase (beta-lactamase superfamily II)
MMPGRTRSACRLRVIAFLAMVGAVTSSAVAADERRGSSSQEAKLNIQLVKTGLFLISGGGANSLMRLSANGEILVDGKRPENHAALMSQVRKISRITDMPVRVVILTNHHEDRAGTNAKFLAAGAQIVAQENVANNLTANHTFDEKVAPPTITYGRDYTVRLGGIEVQLMHFGNACTNGDTVVYFPNLKVVAVGDLFAAGTPNPDFPGGGSLLGWVPVLAEILKLDFDVVVPSAGPMITRDDLVAFKTKIEILVSRARALVNKGVPKEQLLSQLNPEDFGWQFNFSPDDVDRFYAELSSSEMVSEHPGTKQASPE